MAISNADWLAALQRNFPNFKNLTAHLTSDIFTQRGVMPMLNNQDIMNDFWKLSVLWYTAEINPPRAKNYLEESDYGDNFQVPYGDLIRKIYVDQLKPVDPAYVNLVDRQSVDQQIVRKGSSRQAFWRYNWHYANMVTIPDTWQQVQIFTTEGGIEEYIAAQMMALDSAYTAQTYVQELATIGAGLYDTDMPLQTSQRQKTTGLLGDFNQDNLYAFALQLRKAITAFRMGPYSHKYNQAEWDNVQDRDRLRLVLRAGLLDEIAMISSTNAAPFEKFSLPIDNIVEVPYIGIPVPYKDEELTTQVYPVYDKEGVQIGYSETDGATEKEIENKDVFWKDEHPNFVAALVDKGTLFRCQNIPRRVAPAPHNERGLFITFHDTAPNQGTFWDPYHNAIIFEDATTATASLSDVTPARALTKSVVEKKSR